MYSMDTCVLSTHCCCYVFYAENVPVSTPLIEFMVRRREEKKLALIVSPRSLLVHAADWDL